MNVCRIKAILSSIALALLVGALVFPGQGLARADTGQTGEIALPQRDMGLWVGSSEAVSSDWWAAVQRGIGQADLYPLTVTPDWTATDDQTDAQFARALSTAGDVNGDGYSDLIVGAPWYDSGQIDEGRAFLYYGSASGLGPGAAWTAEADQEFALLGLSVGTVGDVNGDGCADIWIAAPGYDGEQQNVGRIDVYHGSPSGLGQLPDWTLEGNQAGENVGQSVSAAGDVDGDGYADLVVGRENGAQVFHGSASGLGQTPDWTVTGEQARSGLGAAVETAGDVNGDGYADIAVGARGRNNDQQWVEQVHVYHGSSAGLASTPAWTVESLGAFSKPARFVSAIGDVNGDGYADLALAAPPHNGSGASEGQLEIYHGSSTGLSATPVWTEQGNGLFELAGDVNGDGYADLIVGSADGDEVYVYHGAQAGLSENAAWTLKGLGSVPLFASAVDTAGDVNGDGYADLVVGTLVTTDWGEWDGWAYVYHGAASGLSTSAGWTVTGGQPQDHFGLSVGTAEDVNGDGYADLVVGAPYMRTESGSGRAFVYYGSPSGPSTTADWTAESDGGHTGFGGSVGTAGDVNGDGYADLVVGAYSYSDGQEQEGRVYVYYGSANGLGTEPDWTAEGDQARAWFGASARTAGDVNGDGYADLVVGADRYDGGQEDEGRAYLYYGSASGLGTSPAWTAEGAQAGARFGAPVATAGDLNQDSYADIVVGATGYDPGTGSFSGRACVYYGSSTGLSTTPDWTVDGDQGGTYLGLSVGTAGDVNGDGYADLVVGAPLYNGELTAQGQVYVYYGSASELSPAPDWAAAGEWEFAMFGNSTGTAGDVNGDGYADLVVGAAGYHGWPYVEDRTYVYHGDPTGLATTADWVVQNDQADAWFGESAATSGDVNGDGYADLVVGAPGYDLEQENERGRTYLFYGNGGSGLSLTPRQRSSDDRAPIAPLGRSPIDAFRLAIRGRTPFGRGKVKLEWEVKPLGTPFDGTSLGQSAAWIDTGVAGAEIGELAQNLQADTPHHWRVRLRYHPATTPLHQTSRWLTVLWNGWAEQDLKTGASFFDTHLYLPVVHHSPLTD